MAAAFCNPSSLAVAAAAHVQSNTPHIIQSINKSVDKILDNYTLLPLPLCNFHSKSSQLLSGKYNISHSYRLCRVPQKSLSNNSTNGSVGFFAA